jgi:hypothetical protein
MLVVKNFGPYSKLYTNLEAIKKLSALGTETENLVLNLSISTYNLWNVGEFLVSQRTSIVT